MNELINTTQLIYITQPDQTVSIGVGVGKKCNDNDISMYDKVFTIKHYGTITTHDVNVNVNAHEHMFNVYTRLKGFNVMLRTFMMLLSFLIVVYDYYMIKYRVNCVNKGMMLQKLRNAHVYMNDVEIKQIVYSFMLVYIGGCFVYAVVVVRCVVEDKKWGIWMCMNVVLFMIVYHGIEIVIKENNTFALVVRGVSFVGFKLWFKVKCEIDEVGMMGYNGGYGDYLC